MKIKLIAVLTAVVLLYSSCATIISGSRQKVYINSNPEGADIIVNGSPTGQKTPAEINLKRRVKSGPNSTAKKMTYSFKKDGYMTKNHVDNSKFNAGPFIVGALFTGAFTLIIDPAVGSLRVYPDSVYVNLVEGDDSKIESPINNEQLTKYATMSVDELEVEKEKAVLSEDFNTAEMLKVMIQTKKDIAAGKTPAATANPVISGATASFGNNKRDIAFKEIEKSGIMNNVVSESAQAQAVQPKTQTNNNVGKLKNAEGNVQVTKYRRSSLYTLMINDNDRLHANVIKNSFGNSEIPTKFNDHNIGPYLIDGKGGEKDQSDMITNYLQSNEVAKKIIAKWFNRDTDGKFSMDLVAARGMYDATAMDKSIANQTERADALLADAGEELIKNTFVIVNDYKYMNKEEIAAKAKKGMAWANVVTSAAGVDISTVTDIASAGATVAGKGYIVRSTSYLYRLVWDEETAAIFYQNHWTDNNNFNSSKVDAFNKADNYKLVYIGEQNAWADVQSSIFTNKSETDLIQLATVKATDRAIAKLQKKYEEFRTMTPLFSVNPDIKAKIGLKEGLEKGDKFEVLEQRLDENNKTIYKRVGVIKVGDQIWDNTLTNEEIKEIGESVVDKQFTVFKGSGKFYPGQLIKQIN
jgi:hypothetical protein